MARNVSEYNALINLRQAIVGKAEAQNRATDTQKRADEQQNRINSMKFNWNEPNNVAIYDHTRALKSEFSHPQYTAAKFRGGLWYGTKLAVFILLALAVLVGGAYLTYRIAIWSWNASVGSMTGMSYVGDTLTYNLAVGIHLFGLSLVMIGMILASIFGGIFLLDKCMEEWPGNLCSIGGGIVSGVLAIVSLCAACSYYYADVSGFWLTLLTYLGSFLAIPLVLRSMLMIICILLAGAATIAGSIALFYVCTLFEYDYSAPDVDYSKLYKTKEYREAQNKDALATQEYRKKYTKDYEEAKKKFELSKKSETQKKEVYNKAIAQYRTIIQKCDYLIQHTTCLHPSYKNLKSLNIILYYIEYNRADTIKEAINEYVHDQHALAFLDKLDSIDSKLSQLTEIQAKQLREIRSGIMAMESRMNQMQNAITASINSVGASLDSTLNRINKDNNRNAQAQLETDKTIAQRLSWIGDHTYHLLHK